MKEYKRTVQITGLKRKSEQNKRMKQQIAHQDSNDDEDNEDESEYAPPSKKVKSRGVCSIEKRTCRICGLISANAHALSIHVKRHSKVRQFKCELCPSSFPVIFELKKHITTHSNERPYTCSVCPVTFKSKSHKLKHERNHQFKSHNCRYCEKSFDNITDKRAHENTHSEGKFDCSYCIKKFLNREFLQEHEKKAHLFLKKRNAKKSGKFGRLKQTPNNNSIKCQVCSERIISRQRYLTHVEEFHPEQMDKLFEVCPYCGKKFIGKRYLIYHVLKHEGKAKHKCTICSYSTGRRTEMVLHMNSHSTIKSQVCHICGASFKSRNSIKRHLDTHLNNRDKMCEVCGKRYFSEEALNRHFKTSNCRFGGVSNPIPFLCSFCKKTFTTSKGLKNHMEKIHENTDDQPTICEHCGQFFDNVFKLRKHLAGLKTTEKRARKRYKCKFCEKYSSKFSSYKDLISHCKSDHPLDVKKCVLCTYTHFNIEKFLKHIKNHKDLDYELGFGEFYAKEESKSNVINTCLHTCEMCGFTSILKAEIENHVDSFCLDLDKRIHYTGDPFSDRLPLKICTGSENISIDATRAICPVVTENMKDYFIPYERREINLTVTTSAKNVGAVVLGETTKRTGLTVLKNYPIIIDPLDYYVDLEAAPTKNEDIVKLALDIAFNNKTNNNIPIKPKQILKSKNEDSYRYLSVDCKKGIVANGKSSKPFIRFDSKIKEKVAPNPSLTTVPMTNNNSSILSLLAWPPNTPPTKLTSNLHSNSSLKNNQLKLVTTEPQSSISMMKNFPSNTIFVTNLQNTTSHKGNVTSFVHLQKKNRPSVPVVVNNPNNHLNVPFVVKKEPVITNPIIETISVSKNKEKKSVSKKKVKPADVSNYNKRKYTLEQLRQKEEQPEIYDFEGFSDSLTNKQVQSSTKNFVYSLQPDKRELNATKLKPDKIVRQKYLDSSTTSNSHLKTVDGKILKKSSQLPVFDSGSSSSSGIKVKYLFTAEFNKDQTLVKKIAITNTSQDHSGKETKPDYLQIRKLTPAKNKNENVKLPTPIATACTKVKKNTLNDKTGKNPPQKDLIEPLLDIKEEIIDIDEESISPVVDVKNLKENLVDIQGKKFLSIEDLCKLKDSGDLQTFISLLKRD